LYKISGFSVGLACSGLVSAEVDVRIVFNVTTPTGNTTVVEIRRRKICFVGKSQVNTVGVCGYSVKKVAFILLCFVDERND